MLAATLLALLSIPASAQTLTLTVHVTSAGAGGTLRVVSGTGGPMTSCTVGGNATCTVFLNQGANVRLAADNAGRLSFGTGPAAACELSTCSFTMTANADVTVTWTAGDGPAANVTTTLAGDGSGTVWADGAACQSGSCAVKYLMGSSIQLTASPVGAARFTGYSSGSGDASACGPAAVCTFTLSGDTSVTGIFVALTSFTVAPSTAIGVPGGPAQTFTVTGTYSSGPTAAIASAPGAWSAAPSMPTGRANLAAAALGGKVYSVGGTVAFSAQNGLTEFDPATGMWTPRAPMILPRALLAAAPAGGQLYAMGGSDGFFAGSTPLASVERYDPTTDAWTMRAPMSAPRQGLAAGTVNGIIYAAGGGAGPEGPVLATLEAYDPASDTWTQRAPMPTPRWLVAGGVIDGIFYVVGGRNGTSDLSTVEAYNPATNTWTARAPLPVPLAGAASAVADGVLYVMVGRLYEQSVVYAYDPVADAWSVKTPMRTPLSELAAASLNGIVYAIGGSSTDLFHTVKSSPVVQTFVDGLRWSSSAPAVAHIDQMGVATPLAASIATIVANVGGTTCGSSCPTFSVVGPSDMSLDAPANNTSVPIGTTLTIGGWALNKAAPTGTGVDAIHVYAVPDGGSAIFLGVAPYGEARPDVGAIFGSQFTNSGFTLKTGSTLAAGIYTVIAYAHNALTQQFDVAKSARVTVTPPVSNPFLYIDTPAVNATVTSAFEVGGWAIDAGAPAGTGVDGVQFYVQPQGAPAPGVFIGTGSYGWPRPDVAAIFGSRFTNVGYHFTITGMAPGAFTLNVYAHSTVTNRYSIVRAVPITVSGTALMSIDTPSAEATIAASSLLVGGWSIDRTIEATALSGTGVDTLHVYAYPDPGSGQAPIFLGVATVGVARPDVGTAYGSRYDTSGYELVVDRAALGLTPGVYDIAVHSHSSVSGTFNNVAVVRITLQ